MSVNKRQFGTDIVINNTRKSQGTVDMHLRYCGIFEENLLKIHYWVCLWKNVKISQHLAKLRARKLIYWFIYSRAVSCWRRTCLSRVWQEIAVANCCSRISLDLDNYQTGVGLDRFWVTNTIRDEYFLDYNFQLMNFASQFESCVAVYSRSSLARRFLEHIFPKLG